MIDTDIQINDGVIFRNAICCHYGKVIGLNRTYISVDYGNGCVVNHHKNERYIKELTTLAERSEFKNKFGG